MKKKKLKQHLLCSRMAKRFSTEEAADLIVNDEFSVGEMGSADTFDKDWSSRAHFSI